MSIYRACLPLYTVPDTEPVLTAREELMPVPDVETVTVLIEWLAFVRLLVCTFDGLDKQEPGTTDEAALDAGLEEDALLDATLEEEAVPDGAFVF